MKNFIWFLKNFIWVLKNFGIVVSMIYLWNSLCLRIKRLFSRERIKRFEDLTDEEATQVAMAFGIYKYYDRHDLNQIWKDFDRTLH